MTSMRTCFRSVLSGIQFRSLGFSAVFLVIMSTAACLSPSHADQTLLAGISPQVTSTPLTTQRNQGNDVPLRQVLVEIDRTSSQPLPIIKANLVSAINLFSMSARPG